METSSPSSKKATHTPAHTPSSPPASLLPQITEVPAKDTGCAATVVVGGLEDDKDRIVVEIMQMYSRQQEKLNSTLHKQLQLEMVNGPEINWTLAALSSQSALDVEAVNLSPTPRSLPESHHIKHGSAKSCFI